MTWREIQHDFQRKDDRETSVAAADLEPGAPGAEQRVPLDALLEDDDDIVTLAETIVDWAVSGLDDLVVAAESSVLVRDLVGRLGPRARRVLLLRYGFVEDRAHSVVEIARILGTFPTSVEGMERRALSRMRRWARSPRMA